MQAIYTQTDKKVELADLSKRVVAFTVDVLLLLSLIGLIDYLTYSSDEQAYLLKPERILDFSLGWLYFAGMEICACQATIGKYLLGLKVTTTTDNRISFKNATIRYFAKPISVVMVMMRFIVESKPVSRRTFHDKLADSVVVTL
ncbi:putative RDD family membrane protein YckC [Pontibacter aydingkolensis]|uniref:RDD family protein n=1 Tax=Pontibacter aydingkolensis TaxID=1911536 RepID=A0ABS7CYS0_9BACT|nr:RDD family protein [Pontibacter aydingkolensis]MBW7468977.1 RDD family protein [Pontibacter aydingkolensis]